MHPNFYGTCVGSVSLPRQSVGKVVPKLSTKSSKVVYSVNGKRSCALFRDSVSATNFAYSRAKAGAQTVWIESDGDVCVIKGTVVYR